MVLQETTGWRECVPIWIGPAELGAIAVALNRGRSPTSRPLTHTLLLHVLDALGGQLTRVRITTIHDGNFYAVLELHPTHASSAPAPTGWAVSARPSDAVIVALHQQCPVLVDDPVWTRAAVSAQTLGLSVSASPATEPDRGPGKDPDAESARHDDTIEQLRRSLNGIDADDFRLGN